MLNGNIPENPPEPQQAGGMGSAMETAILAQLINSPQFVQIKQLLRTNPAALQPVLAQIQQSSPQIYSVILLLISVNSLKPRSFRKIDHGRQ